VDAQKRFWNWHWQHWKERKVLNDWTERRAQEFEGLIQKLGMQNPRILDLGCGLGWFTERLANFGEAHGIDLSPGAIAAARTRRPDITYIVGNVYDAPLPTEYFDLVISQEVIAHVDDQTRYIRRAAEVLKPGGYLIISTSNKFVKDRLGDVNWNVQPPEHIAHEISRGQLRRMLAPRFRVLHSFTIIPHGKVGILRLVNSYKLNSFLQLFAPKDKIDRLKEMAGFGWQMIFLAQKKYQRGSPGGRFGLR
jgi:SAM-dependent methyltransferase